MLSRAGALPWMLSAAPLTLSLHNPAAKFARFSSLKIYPHYLCSLQIPAVHALENMSACRAPSAFDVSSCRDMLVDRLSVASVDSRSCR
ncbi:uncharacterized protein CC84DRAFT_1159777 [Paraphaeosphaeria sporulosa]|uniref:Secreted protein n=1 Tax=Paraphaeosphaeria sporulosa TaxID=1460663 RepID=A0A177CY59_9PLEO|nr:uncharacterized protein CC84DRAFT_1159777 [Paraphaeosphaeria sporulosa]OAG12473.1 hypothetical protein CC84DRAFT_1159777 [Paraphaeosphaeria sporulosa]